MKKVKRFCKICGKELKYHQSTACSPEHGLQVKHNNRVQRYCRQCGKELSLVKYGTTFCDQSCAAIYNNKARQEKKEVEYTADKSAGKVPTCLYCGREIGARKKYCSNVCSAAAMRERSVKAWKEGRNLTGDIYLSYIPPFIRRYLFEKFDGKCAKCGWHEVNPKTGKSPLAVEHIDGNSQNYMEENLTLLCPNCHSLTPTYGSLNKGNGRGSLRKKLESTTLLKSIV